MAMLEDAATLPDDPDDLRAAAVSLVSLVKSQALSAFVRSTDKQCQNKEIIR